MYDDERPRADARVLNQISEMRSMARHLFKASRKCELDEQAEQQKAMNAMRENNLEKARTYGESSIAKHNEAQNYVKLATRLESVVSRLDTQVKLNAINSNFTSIVKSLQKSVEKSKGSPVLQTMEAFEQTFAELDAQTATLTSFMDSTLASKAPTAAVDELLAQLADTHHLETKLELPRAKPPVSVAEEKPQGETRVMMPTEEAEMSDLERRFAELKKSH